MDSDDIETIKMNIAERVPITLLNAWELIKQTKNVDLLRQALQLNSSLATLKDPMGRTLLFKAATIEDNKDIIKLLFDVGSDIEAKDNINFTPLCIAIQKWRYGNARLLMDLGANVNYSVGPRSALPLELSLNVNLFIMMSIIIERKVNLLLAIKKRFLLLETTIRWGNEELLLELLKLDEYVNRINDKDKYGRTLLMLALQQSKSYKHKIIPILLYKGARIELRDNLGRDAFFVAAQFGRYKIIERFMETGYKLDSTNYMKTYKSDHPNVIFATIKYCYQIHHYGDKKEFTEELITKLIDFAPNEILNHVDGDGNTLLHLIAKLKHYYYAIYNKLLKTNIDRNVRNQSGFTAEDIFGSSAVPKFISSAGQYYLDNLIQMDKCKSFIDQALQSGVIVKEEHINSAIKLFDSNIPDVLDLEYINNTYYKGKRCQTLKTLIDHYISVHKNENYERKKIIEHALITAFSLDKYKVVYFFLFFHFISKEQIKNYAQDFVTSKKMDKFIETLLNVTISKAVVTNKPKIGIRTDIELMLPAFLDLYIEKFIHWKANDYDNNISKYNHELSRAVDFRYVKTATFLIQQGPREILNREQEELIESEFPDDFKELYKESKGVGLLTLEQTARIAVRSDLKSFHEAWSIYFIRPVLQFRSKMYEVDQKDIQKNILFHFENYRNSVGTTDNETTRELNALKHFMSEGNWDVSTLLNSLLRQRHSSCLYHIIETINRIDEYFRFSNPLFEAIENDNRDEIERLIQDGEVDVNHFYNGQILNALHYAMIFNRTEIVELLKKHGSDELPLKSSPEISFEDFKDISFLTVCCKFFNLQAGDIQ